MPGLPGVPPGRAGRNVLRRRLTAAERGREQLDRKLRFLFPEQQRLSIKAARVHADWESACSAAQAWLLRAAVLGGQDAIRGASPTEQTRVEVEWTTTMGLGYPREATLAPTLATGASPGPAALRGACAPSGNAAIAPATAAFHTALAAGVRTAAAEEAVRRVDAEIAVTRRRLRALDRRWLPRLQQELTRLDLGLEQGEQEDGLRLRRAAGPQAGEQQPGRRSLP